MAWLTLFLATCTIGVQICWAGQQYKPKPSNSTTGSAEWLDKPSKRQCLVLWKKVREDGLLRLLMIASIAPLTPVAHREAVPWQGPNCSACR